MERLNPPDSQQDATSAETLLVVGLVGAFMAANAAVSVIFAANRTARNIASSIVRR